MRKQKDEELEHYKKEIERAKRFENQKLSGGAAAQGERSAVIAKKKIITNPSSGQNSVQKVRLVKQ